jgi:thioredoxin reductase (NADPH)
MDTDCLIIGAGPGGLVAATYLGRYRRPPLVMDAGHSRARWIPTSHNIPGFPTGIGGPELLALLRNQASRYGADFRTGQVERLTRDEAAFVAAGEGFRIRARRVILATGVDDAVPGMAEIAAGIRNSRIRLCPICDGYEVSGMRVGVIGPPDRAFREARFLTAYTRDLTLMRMEQHPEPSASEREICRQFDFNVVAEPVTAIEVTADGVAVRGPGGTETFETVYIAMGGIPRSTLADRIGAVVGREGYVEVDPHQRTGIPGLYAAGDVVHELNQVAVAAGHAAIAATDVHNSLSREERGEA